MVYISYKLPVNFDKIFRLMFDPIMYVCMDACITHSL